MCLLMIIKNRFLVFEVCIIFLVVFSPVFFGSFLPPALSVVQLISFFVLAYYLFRFSFKGEGCILYPGHILFILIFLVIALFQLIPLPAALVKIISPKAFYLQENYSLSGLIPFYKLSHNVSLTKAELIKFTAYFSVFLVNKQNGAVR